jgi:hypothetical protein
MSPHLQQCLDIILDATNGAGAEASVRRDPAKWSVVEVVEHLERAYSGTAKGFERCLEKDASLATPVSLKQRFFQFVVVEAGYFPEGRQAPKHILPTGQVDLSTALAATRAGLERLDAVSTRIRDRFGRARVLDHPILGAFSLDQWLKFHVIHTRHHERQIRTRR